MHPTPRPLRPLPLRFGAVAAAVFTAVAWLPAQRPPIAAPFFQLRLENSKVFAESDYAPLFAELGGLLADRLGVEGDGNRERLAEAWRDLRWPIDVIVVLDRDRDAALAGAWLPPDGAPVLERIEPCLAGRSRPTPALVHEGEPFRGLALTSAGGAVERVLSEGACAGRRLLLLASGNAAAEGNQQAVLDFYVRSAERDTPSRELLEAHARGGDLGFVFSYQSLFALPEGRIGFEPAFARLLLGPRFAGVSGRVSTAEDGGLEVELFADVRPRRGWIGACVHAEPRDLELTRWLPRGVSTFVAADVSVDAVVRSLRGSGFSSLFAAAALPESAKWLDGVSLVDLLDTHFTGQVIAATEQGIETQFRDLEQLEGFAVGLGVFDGHELIAELVRLARENGGEEAQLEETPALGPGVHTLTCQGAPLVYVAAAKTAVFVSRAEPAGAAMLRKCLSTGGRGELPEEARRATMVGRGHVLQHVLHLVEEVDAGGAPRARDLPDVLRSFLSRHGGVAEWRLAIDADGAVLRVRL